MQVVHSRRWLSTARKMNIREERICAREDSPAYRRDRPRAGVRASLSAAPDSRVLVASF